MNLIKIENINLGGISDSLYQGQSDSVTEAVGFNIHSEPGILKNNQKLTKESESTIDDLCKTILVCSDGNTYLFGSTNGKVWKRTSAGVYSLVATISPEAGSAGVLDAYEYRGYIYYCTQNRLGRVIVGDPTDWSGRSDNFSVFTNGNASYHPIKEVNQVMYIGDGNLLAQVDDGVFTADALDIKEPLIIKSLGKISTDILLGTYVNDNIIKSEILRWNTWSESFSVADEIPETGVNSFLDIDNYVLASAGDKGNLYYYNGTQLENYKRIKGDWTGSNKATVYQQATCNYFGLPFFGLSNTSGNPTNLGLYSMGGYDRNYPKVLNLENVISTGNKENIEIGAVKLVGDTLLVSWKDTNDTTTYGIDKIDSTAKVSSAYISTRVINVSRSENKLFTCNVGYRSLPSGSSIKIYYKVNYASSWTEMDTTTDTIRNIITAKYKFPEASTLEVKIESNASSTSVNESPEIDIIEILFE